MYNPRIWRRGRGIFLTLTDGLGAPNAH